MAQDTLMKKLEEVAGKAKQLERERSEALAKIQSLEREASELKSLISLAESKADEILKGVPATESPKGHASTVSTASKGLPDLMEPSASQQEELKRRFPHAFSST